jgi:hypothetical protein
MSTAIALIPLVKGARLSRSKTIADLKSTWSIEVESSSSQKEGESKEGVGVLTLGFGDSFAAIGLMPVPIPASELAGPIETSVLWPDAGKDLAQSRGHLIVSLITNSEVDAIELRKQLTRIVASVLVGCEGTQGVYWGDATMLIRSDVFREMAVESLPEPPLILWIDFRVGLVREDKAAGFTTGMEALGLMEIECDAANEPPSQFRDRLLGIATYLVANGLVIQNGHTIGEDEHERIRVVYGKSSFGHENAVMKLEYEPVKKKPFWKRG